jgi:polyisoprenoid-binding protein YceI
VEKFPTAKFEGSQFVFDGSKVKSVSGTLTLLGKTQPVTLNADQYACYDHPRLKVQVCAGDFSTTIKRSQWGMEPMPAILPDEVRLVIQVEAVKQP